MIIPSLEAKIHRWINKNLLSNDPEAVICALREILQLSDRGRNYRREILSCYSRTRQAEIQPEFVIAIENVLVHYQGKKQMSLFGGGAA